MGLQVNDKVCFTDSTGHVVDDIVTSVEYNNIEGEKYDLTLLYLANKLSVYRDTCNVCGCDIPIRITTLKSRDLDDHVYEHICTVCKEERSYPQNPEDGVTLWI